MAGIRSYGAYVPRTRLPLSMLGERPGKEGGPEKAVAWNDEDAITMAVGAAISCLEGFDRTAIDAVFFASTTHSFREKQAAALIARALDLGRGVRTVDHAGSLRAGTTALRAAFDAVSAGSARNVLVVASDARMAAPGSALEANFGDGAAAFWVSEQDEIACLASHHALADEILDVWRSEGDPFVHSWEDRFVVQEGYVPRICEAVQGLVQQDGGELGDFSRVALYAPDARSHATAARKLGVSSEQLVPPLFGQLGNTGTAFAPMQLALALETTRPGQRILLASYGDGAEALSFEVGDAVSKLEPRRGVRWHLERRRPARSYDAFLKARSLGPSEWDPGSNPGLSATIHFRERDEDLSLRGQRCKACGAVQFPAQRVCETCFNKDDFESVRLSDRIGRVVTYTFDYFFPTPDPPTVVTVTEVDGARIHLQLVNCTPEETRLGMPVEFVFRRIHESGGRPNYYWKGNPVEDGSPVEA